jgi:hypothetical protein
LPNLNCDPTDQPVYVQDGQVPANTYPRWEYFPRNVRPPEWVEPFVAEVRAIETRISTVDQGTGLHSDDLLRELAPGLRNLGYAVESSRSEVNRIRRPVLYGSNGRAEVAYDIDAFHDDHGIVVEVEAGRAASNNATYRDIIRASLILDAQYLVLQSEMKPADLDLPLDEQVEVVGEQYYPKEIRKLFRECSLPITSAGSTLEDEVCYLVPEPWNPHDSNAVAVMVRSYHVGHLPAALAKRYHPRLIAYAQQRQLVSGVARVWSRLESGTMVRARVTIVVPEVAILLAAIVAHGSQYPMPQVSIALTVKLDDSV